MALWAKSAAGFNLGFVRDFGRIIKSWREIFQSGLIKKKELRTKPLVHEVDAVHINAKGRCLFRFQGSQSNKGKSFRSRLFSSLLSRNYNELRRQAAFRFSTTKHGNFKNMPLLSLVGVTLGFSATSSIDEGTERMMSELQKSFRSFTWQVEPLTKMPSCLDDLIIMEDTIGNGCEGAVFKAKVKTVDKSSVDSVETDEEYDLALKAVFNYSAESNAYSILSELQREIVPLRSECCQIETELGRRVNRLPPHPNIVDMPGVFVDNMLVTEEGMKKFPAALPHSLDDTRFYGRNKTLYLVMRRRNTHLREFLSLKGKEITMATRCQILAQVLEGVAHLTRNGVAHRDIKADNILVDIPNDADSLRVELCDFGCCLAEESKSLKVPFPSWDMYLGGNCSLMAPEVRTATPGPNNVLDFSKSDLWAVGAIAYEVFGAANPFYPSDNDSGQHLHSGSYREEDLPPLPADVPLPVQKLIRAILSRDPHRRPTASVAAAVLQMVCLLSSAGPAAGTSDLVLQPSSSNVAETSTIHQGRHLNKSGTVRNRRSYHRPVYRAPGQELRPPGVIKASRDRAWLNLVLWHGLTLLCRLQLGDDSVPWDVHSVMTFLFLSRLTCEDFRAAMVYF